MSGPDEGSLALKATADAADIVAALAACFSVEMEEGASVTVRYYDDADAHLWRAGILLYEQDGQLFDLDGGDAPAAQAVALPGAKFWWDFPAGALQDTLRRLAGVRALMPVAAPRISHAALTLRNRDRKTVVRARLTRSLLGERDLLYLTFQPLRGYAAELAEALRCVKPLVAARCALDTRTLLARHRIAAFGARRAPSAPISEAMPAEQAVRSMAHLMLEQAQQQVAGVVADIDSEFLHDYRVGLRKTRSLLSLMKQTLPAAALDRLKPRLAAMAGATNALRDLDVYLLAQHDYRALLPPGFQPGMDELAALVRTLRTREQQRIALHLSAPGYRADVDACLAELSLQAALATPAASKPVLHLVKRQLLKRHAAIRAQAGLIDRGCDDEALHALRIELKKLRYLIEFFADLLPKKRVARILADLKRLQGVLGEFNDVCVQSAFLAGFVDDRRPGMTRALSALIGILHVKKVEMRERIFEAIASYFTETRAIEFGLVFKAPKLENTR